MKFNTTLVAAATVAATALGSLLVPGAAAPSHAAPLVGDTQSQHQDHDGVGVHAITVSDREFLTAGQTFTIKALVAKDYNGKVFPKEFGVGLDAALAAALERTSASFKQYTSAQEIKDKFPADKLAQLPSEARQWLNSGGTVSARNTLNTDVSFVEGKATDITYAKVEDRDYSSDKEGLGTELLAGEFTFTLKSDVSPAKHLAGTYVWVPGYSLYSRLGTNWQPDLAKVDLTGKKAADITLNTPSAQFDKGDKVTLSATVTPNNVPGNVTFTVGDTSITATINNGVAEAQYTMTDKPVAVSASIEPTGDFTGAKSSTISHLTPKNAPAQPLHAGETKGNPDPNGQPATQGFDIKSDWWKILLGILGVLGLGGAIAGAFAFLQGPR